MSTGGWIMIALSWVVILVLVIFCYTRILGVHRANIRAPLEIETEEKD